MHLLAVTKGFKAHASHIRSKTSAYFHFTAAETEAQISYFSCCSLWSWCVWQHQECDADLITFCFTHKTIFSKGESPEGGRWLERGNKIHKML